MAEKYYNNRHIPRLFNEGDRVVIKEAQEYDKDLGIQEGMEGTITEVTPIAEPVSYRVKFDHHQDPFLENGFSMYQEQLERI